MPSNSSAEYKRQHRLANPEMYKEGRRRRIVRFRETKRRWRAAVRADPARYAVYKSKALAATKKWQAKLKSDAIAAYGGKCKCCGERIPKLLTIDHIDGGGNKHRRSLGTGGRMATSVRFYTWLRSNKYPKAFQLLCWNCNLGKHLNGGVCPHKENARG